MANDQARTGAGDSDIRDRTLVVERMFKASPERVFKAWTDPSVLIRWWGPEDFKTPDPQIDLRVGGKWRSEMLGPDGQSHTVSGVYREIVSPRRLVMTWGWESDGKRGHETVVEVTLEQVAGGTRLRLVQGVFENPKSRDGHDWGWTSSFARLERMLG